MVVSLFNRQRSVALPLGQLRMLATEAAKRCLTYRGKGSLDLQDLAEVEITVVSDRVIAQVHRRFMNIPGATDVITFAHGEIVVSAATAARQARQNGEAVEREVARYIVHGFLHLHGHEDADPKDASVMWQAQEQVLDALWPSPLQASHRPGIAS